MKDGNAATACVIDALVGLEIDYLLAGSYSSNYYGIPRSTRDVDFVAVFLSGIGKVADAWFVLDPQTSFESVTGTLRNIFIVPSIAFKIGVFHLSEDEHDRRRFERRCKVFDEGIGREVSIPAVEDVIVT